MTNKLKVRTVQIIDSFDLDALVKEVYGKPYCFQQQDDCKARGTHSVTIPDQAYDDEKTSIPEVINGSKMGVSFAAWLARDPKEWNGDPKRTYSLDLFWERNFYPDVQMILNDLYDKGLVQAGEYVIEIDW
jgi:hypothetical protein